MNGAKATLVMNTSCSFLGGSFIATGGDAKTLLWPQILPPGLKIQHFRMQREKAAAQRSRDVELEKEFC